MTKYCTFESMDQLAIDRKAEQEAVERALCDGWYLKQISPKLPVMMFPPRPTGDHSKPVFPSVGMGRVRIVRGKPTVLINTFYQKYLPAQELMVGATLLHPEKTKGK